MALGRKNFLFVGDVDAGTGIRNLGHWLLRRNVTRVVTQRFGMLSGVSFVGLLIQRRWFLTILPLDFLRVS